MRSDSMSTERPGHLMSRMCPVDWGEFTVDVAAPQDASAFLRLRDEAAGWLSSRGIDQWRPGDFAPSWLDTLIAEKRVFLLRHGEELAATVTVLWDDPFVWGEQEVEAGYIHNLIVARSFAGQGLGRRLLQWAEDHVAVSGRSLARLDCVVSNGELRHLYESAGYHWVRDGEFLAEFGLRPTALYEKTLRASHRHTAVPWSPEHLDDDH